MKELLRRTLLVPLVLIGCMVVGAYAYLQEAHAEQHRDNQERMSTMKIRLVIRGASINATLFDNSTARDFISLLPMTVTLEDYAATEKITYLPRKLSIKDAPAGIDPSVGDITYYAPWGNLAIFYRDFAYSKGLVKLGRIDSGTGALNAPGSVKVTIEAVAD